MYLRSVDYKTIAEFASLCRSMKIQILFCASLLLNCSHALFADQIAKLKYQIGVQRNAKKLSSLKQGFSDSKRHLNAVTAETGSYVSKANIQVTKIQKISEKNARSAEKGRLSVNTKRDADANLAAAIISAHVQKIDGEKKMKQFKEQYHSAATSVSVTPQQSKSGSLHDLIQHPPPPMPPIRQ